jgi:hypothetical protein
MKTTLRLWIDGPKNLSTALTYDCELGAIPPVGTTICFDIGYETSHPTERCEVKIIDKVGRLTVFMRTKADHEKFAECVEEYKAHGWRVESR